MDWGDFVHRARRLEAYGYACLILSTVVSVLVFWTLLPSEIQPDEQWAVGVWAIFIGVYLALVHAVILKFVDAKIHGMLVEVERDLEFDMDMFDETDL